jgi:hypothetical protein
MIQGRAAPRDVTIESAALLDQQLASLLTANGQSARGDLNAKIERAFQHRLISEHDHRVLHRVRRIRNAFGHDPDLHHFEHDETVRQLCDELAMANESPMSRCERFAWAALCVAVTLQNAIGKAQTRS